MGVNSHKGRGREEKDMGGDIDTKIPRLVVIPHVQTLDTLLNYIQV